MPRTTGDEVGYNFKGLVISSRGFSPTQTLAKFNMDKKLSLVKVDTRHYREIAQDNWGLTNEQMSGMHVHHRVPRSIGGSNDPSNLYVCSPWFHGHVWHAEDGYNSLIPFAKEGGRKGGLKTCIGPISYEKKFGIFGLDPQLKKQAEVKGGVSTFLSRKGCHDPKYRGAGAKTTNSTMWEDPDHPELGHLPPGPLSRKQKALGLPHGKENRRKVI